MVCLMGLWHCISLQLEVTISCTLSVFSPAVRLTVAQSQDAKSRRTSNKQVQKELLAGMFLAKARKVHGEHQR